MVQHIVDSPCRQKSARRLCNPLSVSVGTVGTVGIRSERCAKLIVAAHLVMYTRAYHHLPLRSIPVLTS